MTETGVVGVALAVVAITPLLSGIFGLLGGFLLIGLLITLLDLTTGNLLISTVLIATTFFGEHFLGSTKSVGGPSF